MFCWKTWLPRGSSSKSAVGNVSTMKLGSFQLAFNYWCLETFCVAVGLLWMGSCCGRQCRQLIYFSFPENSGCSCGLSKTITLTIRGGVLYGLVSLTAYGDQGLQVWRSVRKAAKPPTAVIGQCWARLWRQPVAVRCWPVAAGGDIDEFFNESPTWTPRIAIGASTDMWLCVFLSLSWKQSTTNSTTNSTSRVFGSGSASPNLLL